MMKPETGTNACRICTDGSGAATREEADRDYDTDAEILTLNVRARRASAPSCY